MGATIIWYEPYKGCIVIFSDMSIFEKLMHIYLETNRYFHCWKNNLIIIHSNQCIFISDCHVCHLATVLDVVLLVSLCVCFRYLGICSIHKYNFYKLTHHVIFLYMMIL